MMILEFGPFMEIGEVMFTSMEHRSVHWMLTGISLCGSGVYLRLTQPHSTPIIEV